ncbi:DEAD/DEAH box helicase [Priestia aryabhattai]
MSTFDKNYFLDSNPHILYNEQDLRKIQIESYVEICNHFLVNKSKTHAVAVLPTGSGKTGVMALAPFGISQGRVLIITPQLVIKDHVLDSLDPTNPNNFWLRHNVFNDYGQLPKIVEYDKETFLEELEESNIVILNIHKLSSQSRNSLLAKVKPDFFDMIIVDEAHHSPARTWQNALEYFNDAKVLKVTGTPFRTDRKPIEGKAIVNYRLGKAMSDGIVKTLKNFVLKPEKVYLTLDKDVSKKYTLKEIEALKLKDKDYITRSVAYSPECNQHIIDASIDALNERKERSSVPHKIIAVCCSIEHAGDVQYLYERSGLKTVVVHSKLPPKERTEALLKIETHKVEVVIHVAMLGEGYDHPYLSVAAIFRPYRSLSPYSQFIGRILRKIPEKESNNIIDNIGVIVAHRDLNLEPLWKEYKQEKDYCDILEAVKKSEKGEKKLEKTLKNPKDTEIGSVTAEGDIYTEEEYYEYTQAAESYKAYEENIASKVEQLKTLFPHQTEEQLQILARQQERPMTTNPLLKNPKKYRMMLRSEFNEQVQHEIPATIIAKFNLEKEARNLAILPLNKSFRWVLDHGDNAAIIAKYLNAFFVKKYGPRDEWKIADYQKATSELKAQTEHLINMIKTIL